MRRARLLMLTAALLICGCATTNPVYQGDSAYAFVCVPGSALRRVAPVGAYPDWMTLDKGTCKHR